MAHPLQYGPVDLSDLISGHFLPHVALAMLDFPLVLRLAKPIPASGLGTCCWAQAFFAVWRAGPPLLLELREDSPDRSILSKPLTLPFHSHDSVLFLLSLLLL